MTVRPLLLPRCLWPGRGERPARLPAAINGEGLPVAKLFRSAGHVCKGCAKVIRGDGVAACWSDSGPVYVAYHKGCYAKLEAEAARELGVVGMPAATEANCRNATGC